jgi:hypothetical protein
VDKYSLQVVEIPPRWQQARYSRDSIVTTRTAPNGVSVSTGSSYAYDVNGGLTRTDTTSAQEARRSDNVDFPITTA